MQRVVYYVFRLGIFIFQPIPFPLLYVISDISAWLIYRVFRYRKKVTGENLRKAFPEHSEKRIQQLTWQSYRNLSDILLEGLKGFNMSRDALIKRYTIENPGLLEPYYQQGQSVIGVTAHYANWEWGALAGRLQLNHLPVAFYKPVSNKYIDRFLRKHGAENGTLMRSIYQTTETLRELAHQICLFLMVADQHPSNIKKAYWVNFLGRQTPCLHGPEKHARSNRYPVVYLNIRRQRRGFYRIRIIPLVNDPDHFEPGGITEKYLHTLEQIIIQEPADWLWTHKRWKKMH